MDKSMMSVEEQIAAAQAEVERLLELQREQAALRARYPWQNPDVMRTQQRMGYNFKFEPELYLKVKWITENVGGMKSMQVFLDCAANALANELLEKHGAQ
ncbi:hypothetical protein PQR75_46875 [Paraburkholderia fungorum]|uniref:hypothetical protein n=1 Tax=Paraburkholderia fungorum TaxID=134537 RepID=UPI0038B73E42